jgi:hypothetical protein
LEVEIIKKKKKIREKKNKMAEKIKKPLIREGPNSSPIAELIDNLSKNPVVSFVVITILYQNPKFEVCRFENGENTRLRQTDGKT